MRVANRTGLSVLRWRPAARLEEDIAAWQRAALVRTAPPCTPFAPCVLCTPLRPSPTLCTLLQPSSALSVRLFPRHPLRPSTPLGALGRLWPRMVLGWPISSSRRRCAFPR